MRRVQSRSSSTRRVSTHFLPFAPQLKQLNRPSSSNEKQVVFFLLP